jgi:hypothetical protein
MGTHSALIIHDRAAWVATQDELAQLNRRDPVRHRSRRDKPERQLGRMPRIRRAIAAMTS